MMKLLRSTARMRWLMRDLMRDRRGNVLMLMAFSVIPLTLATGMSVDYGRAARLQTRLNAAADAAALAAVTAPMMKLDNDAAKNAATAMFKAQISGLSGLIWNDVDLKVTISGNNAATTTRTALVTYSAKSTNAFAGVVGMATIEIGGSSTATATAAPNIDFYLALDTSPSMALPTTTGGFDTMDKAVECAFACHSNKIEVYVGVSIPTLILDNDKFAIVKGSYGSTGIGSNKKNFIDAKNTYVYDTKTTTDSKCRNSAGKDICVYNSDGTYVDSYWYALNKGVRLRVTDEKIAASDLMTLAKSYALANARTYRAALYTFDHATNLKTISTLSSDLTAVGTAASNIDLVTVNDKQGNGRPPNGTSGADYLFTSFTSVLDKMITEMPAKSGKGSNDPGDTPQAFLFMVTDGMSDEKSSLVGAPFSLGQDRTRSEIVQAHIDKCTSLKARGIKIAILYTEYTADSIKDDEVNQRTFVEKRIPYVATQLANCASPGLMYTVKTDQSISDALQALFTKAVATARLLN